MKNIQKNISLILAIGGNLFLVWFFLRPLLAHDQNFIENFSWMFMTIELLALCCEAVIFDESVTIGSSSKPYTAKDKKINIFLVVLFSLGWVAMASLAMNNLNVLLVFALSLGTKYLWYLFGNKIDTHPILINIAILMVTSLVAVIMVPAWGILYYSIMIFMILRSFLSSNQPK